MKTKTILLILCLLAFIGASAQPKPDYNNYYWQKMQVTPQSLADSCYWLELYFLPNNPNIGFACGQASGKQNAGGSYYGVFAKTTDGGSTWQASYISTSQFFHAESIIFTSPDVGYVCGDGIYKTLNGGQSWSKLTPAPADLNGLASWGTYAINDKVWLADGRCLGNQIIYTSTNSGRTFTYDTLPNSSGNHITDFKFYDKDKLGYCIGSGRIFETLNGGKTWDTLCDTPEFNWGVYGSTNVNWHEDLNIFGRSIVIPASPGCQGHLGYGRFGGLAFTTNQGQSWTILQTDGAMFGTAIINETTAWGCGNNENVYFTTDAGHNWTLLTCGLDDNAQLDDMWFKTPTDGFVCGGGGIYRLVQKQPIEITISSDSINCNGAAVTITANTSPADVIVNWYEVRPNGSERLIAQNVDSISVSSPGRYIAIAYQAGGEDCNAVRSNEHTVAIESFTPPILAPFPESVCKSKNTMLSISNVDPKWQTIKWYHNGRLVAEGVTSITPAESGQYWVDVASADSICVGLSAVTDITILDLEDGLSLESNDFPLQLDSTKFGQQSFATITLTNRDPIAVTITNIGLAQKLCFSLPAAQFPLTIPAGGSRDITVYYTPTNLGEQTDTLLITDNCSIHTWPLTGVGTKNFDTTASRCDTYLAITTYGIRQQVTVTTPYPNPMAAGTSKGKLGFSVSPKADEPALNLQFYDQLGRKLAADWQLEGEEISYTLPAGLASGACYIVLTYHDLRKTIPLLINNE